MTTALDCLLVGRCQFAIVVGDTEVKVLAGPPVVAVVLPAFGDHVVTPLNAPLRWENQRTESEETSKIASLLEEMLPTLFLQEL